MTSNCGDTSPLLILDPPTAANQLDRPDEILCPFLLNQYISQPDVRIEGMDEICTPNGRYFIKKS